MRFPTSNGHDIAFVAHDDLWITSMHGGVAHRLTHDAGVITNPRFSPNGLWIAYTSRHGGLRDVYVIAAQGGEPKRVTYEASYYADGALVVAWTPDSKRIVFLSHRNTPVAKLVRAFSVSVDGGVVEPLPLNRAGTMSFSPDANSIAYNPTLRNLELRKRYVGGEQQDIYTYNFDSHAFTRITNWKGTDTDPMWFRRKIYFLSDRGKNFRQNIWSLDLNRGTFHQVTHFGDYDIDWPSLGPSAITFQQGGHLFSIDLPSERLRELTVEMPDPENLAARFVDAADTIRSTDAMGVVDYALSSTGDSLLVSARGDLFRIADGANENLTQTPAADEDHGAWSPDGRLLAYETDERGEQQIAVKSIEGGPARYLTNSKKGYFYTPIWSPCGDVLVVADANHGLWYLHLDDVAPQRIAADPNAEIRDAVFSPDGQWIAFSTQRANGLRAIHLYRSKTGEDTIVSSEMESDRNPVFSADGRTLIFISQRNEQTFVSDRDDESLVSTINSDGLYAAALQSHEPSTSETQDTSQTASSQIRIDLPGLMQRAVALPVVPAVIASLQARANDIFYQTKPIQLIDGDLSGTRGQLHAFNLSTFVDRVVVSDLQNFSLSADGTRVAFRRNGKWYTAGAAASNPQGERLFAVTELMMSVDSHLAWAEMFENAWRLDRDVFFSKAMNGTDWQAVHDAYAKLLPKLGSQSDFLYLLGQLQGEIASSHTFLLTHPSGDKNKPERTGLLAADYVMDQASGRFRFAHIYTGDQTRPDMRGPLGVPGLVVREGDYLLAINGQELVAPNTPDSLLAGRLSQVSLTIAPSPAGIRRQLTVTPLSDDSNVRRNDWIVRNRKEVERLSQGKLGYIFLTDFDAEGSKDFVRQFYPQRERQGLIFDIRWNRGGFTSQAMLDVLRRQRAGVFVNRENAVTPLPSATAPSVLVALTNYGSASDGDQFPYFFRQFHLGKIVGERTWGGVQGINAPWELMDGSSITIPKDSLASLDAHWIIENEGVAPDVPLQSLSNNATGFDDAELQMTVKVALDELRTHPARSPHAPAPLPAYPPRGNVPGASFGNVSASTRNSHNPS